jgi:hypothetical protein
MAPVMIWPGRHRIMDRHSARRPVAERSRRNLPVRPGQVVGLDRHLLHGITPCDSWAISGPTWRIMAYYRPQLENTADWLNAP